MRIRGNPNQLAFVVHRISGLCLAAFIPIHLYVMSLLITNPQQLDAFLTWTSTPAVKLSESLLIMLAGIHLAGGIRILVVEWFSVSGVKSRWISVAAGFSVICGILFLTASAQ
ncbi:MAG: hypothetical protein OXI60_00485 [Acidiferrobacterales bacterium]|nr:hypothetical protein [Acidiferrobacterales bacterium]